ncbi:MAG: DUF202 domain-containing protein [Nitrospirota bacterium]
MEDLFLGRGIPKHELLLCLAEFYHLPFVEYDEDLMVSPKILSRIDSERLKTALWFPLAVVDGKAEVIACRPDDPQVLEDIRETLGVEEVEFLVALPRDLIRIIENNQDLNPGFPPSAGRTPLALVRTFLAERRSLFATQRTSLAKGRTGLAFLRTGIAFIAIAVTLLRVFGLGLPSIAGIVLLAFGIAAVYDGFKWYLPIRRNALQKLDYASGQSSDGVTVLKVSNPGDNPVFTRSGAVGGAEELRRGWNGLSPVQRRRRAGFHAHGHSLCGTRHSAFQALPLKRLDGVRRLAYPFRRIDVCGRRLVVFPRARCREEGPQTYKGG